MNRRSLLIRVVEGMGLLVAGVVAVPGVIHLLSPLFKPRRRELWRPVAPVEDFRLGAVTAAVVEVPREDWARALRQQAVYVSRPSLDEVIVFSRNCTDLSCPVNWDPGSRCFFCPCHGGIFDSAGRRMAGPPKRPLFRYASRLRNGMLEINLASLPPIT